MPRHTELGPVVALLAFCLLLLAPSQSDARQDSAREPSVRDPQVDAVAKRIRELQDEIARLLDNLTPEQQAAVRERLSRLEPSETPIRENRTEPMSAGGAATAVAKLAQPSATEAPTAEAATAPSATAPSAEGRAPTAAVSEEAAPEAATTVDTTTEAAAEDIRTEPATPVTIESPAAATAAAASVPEAGTAPPAAPGRSGCQTLIAFDSNADGKLSGLDRHWRHFYLWTDRDGNGEPSENEMEPPYESGIREIALHLRSFVRGKKKKAREQEILVDELLLFDVGNDGWDGAIPRGDDGALAIDADALARANGPRWLDGRGQPVVGIQPVRAGGRFELPDGRVIEIDCP